MHPATPVLHRPAFAKGAARDFDAVLPTLNRFLTRASQRSRRAGPPVAGLLALNRKRRRRRDRAGEGCDFIHSQGAKASLSCCWISSGESLGGGSDGGRTEARHSGLPPPQMLRSNAVEFPQVSTARVGGEVRSWLGPRRHTGEKLIFSRCWISSGVSSRGGSAGGSLFGLGDAPPCGKVLSRYSKNSAYSSDVGGGRRPSMRGIIIPQ